MSDAAGRARKSAHGTVYAASRIWAMTDWRMRRSRLAPTHRTPSTTPQSSRTATMASTLLRRQLAQTARLPPRSAASSLILSSRHISSTTPALVQSQADPSASAQTRGATHTVEDLQGIHASEILAETGTRKDAQMRHFTGEFGLLG